MMDRTIDHAIRFDFGEPRAVGSLIRVSGRVLGMKLLVEEMVTERILPWRKTWEARGEPQLLVIGS